MFVLLFVLNVLSLEGIASYVDFTVNGDILVVSSSLVQTNMD